MKSGVALFWIGILVLLGVVPSSSGQGIIVPSAGPINSAMAGASTAAPVDFGGSYWNPAILSGLDDQEFLLGSALAFPSIHLQSSLPAGSVGGLFPPTNRFGEARSDSGVAAGLATGFSFRMTDDSPLTMGLGIFGLVGGGVNFSGKLSGADPDPAPAAELLRCRADLLESLPPRRSTRWPPLQLTDKLAIGGGPVITAGHTELQSRLLRSGTEGPARASDLPRGHQRAARTGAPGSRSGCSTSSTRTGTWDSRTRARSGRRNGTSTRRIPTCPRAASGSRRACRRSSPGASPTRACPRR